MKGKTCTTEWHPARTWFDHVIKIVGKENNSKVHKRYQNRLPGDSPELMPLDNHLFADIREALGKNIALSYWLKDDDPLKYSEATPMKIYDSICRTIKSGSPSEERIIEDVYRIKEETLRRITEAKGTYIEDSSNKKSRNGVRLAAAREEQKTKKNAIKTDPAVEKKFAELFRDLQKGAAPMPCKFEDGGTRGTIRDEGHLRGEFLTVPLVEERNDGGG